ncbi:hypothetical protein [Pokkaliibacter plantistimulans]|uniref:hypothetical protein n=1 Tax=Pokkaliibacter plantistimulans TaxID=1635171 RepID=UPI001057A121|nr:hypothetical protein [Pokkaliibacter plantistimulans]
MTDLDEIESKFRDMGYDAKVRVWSLDESVMISADEEVMPDGIKRLNGLHYIFRDGANWKITKLCGEASSQVSVICTAETISQIVVKAAQLLEKFKNA